MAAKTQASGKAKQPPAAEQPKKSTALTTAPSATAGNAVANVAEAFAAYANKGLANVTARDVIIPRIGIIQKLSPQYDEKKAEFIKGCKVGNIFDVATGELITSPMAFLPVYFSKQWLEWAPRASGKGLAGIHTDISIVDKCKENEKRQLMLDNGNRIVETSQFFGLNLSMGARKSFIPMSSTQLKKGRRWLTLATSEELSRGDGSTYTPPLFYRTYHLDTVEEKNNDGDWMGWKIERAQALHELEGWEALFEKAVAFEESLAKGEAKADLSDLEADGSIAREATASGDGQRM